MLEFSKIEHYDDFEDVVIFWVNVKNPPIRIREKAKEIDGENYLDSCFGVCVNYDVEKNQFYIVTDWDGNLYYVDNKGDKHWFNVEITEDFQSKLFEMCKNELSK